MKKYFFAPTQGVLSQITEPVRNKAASIRTLLRAIKFTLINTYSKDETLPATLLIQVDKMSRIFFQVDDNKCLSIHFPFLVKEDGDNFIKIYAKNGREIDQKISSDLLSIFRNDEDNPGAIINEEEYFEIITSEFEGDAGVLEVVRELLSYESGYIRYDHDPTRADKKLHPLNHLDVFYSSNTTFKLGLEQKLNLTDFVDVLDLRTDCLFLDKK